MPGWLEITVRSLGAVIILFVLTRILGKKQISQLSLFEYILGITLGELAGFISTDIEAHYTHGLIALFIWFSVPLLFEKLSLRSRKLRLLMEGTSRVVIQNGEILEKNLRKERFSPDELMEELHKKDVYKISDVEFAVLEASGDLNVMLKKQFQPLTLNDLNIPVKRETEPHVVIMEGKVLKKGIDQAGITEKQLNDLLARKNVTLKDVYMGQLEASGKLYIDKYEDNLPNTQTPVPLSKLTNTQEDHSSAALQSLLLQCQSDLERYGHIVTSKKDRIVFKKSASELKRISSQLGPLLDKSSKK